MQSGQATIEFVVPACSTSTGHIISTEVEWRVLLTVGTATAHILDYYGVVSTWMPRWVPPNPISRGSRVGALSFPPPLPSRQGKQAEAAPLLVARSQSRQMRCACTCASPSPSPLPNPPSSCPVLLSLLQSPPVVPFLPRTFFHIHLPGRGLQNQNQPSPIHYSPSR